MVMELQGKWRLSLTPDKCSIGGTTLKGLHVMDLLNISMIYIHTKIFAALILTL
jgi:hypothetical protein